VPGLTLLLRVGDALLSRDRLEPPGQHGLVAHAFGRVITALFAFLSTHLGDLL
jgi:hypothetical protein